MQDFSSPRHTPMERQAGAASRFGIAQALAAVALIVLTACATGGESGPEISPPSDAAAAESDAATAAATSSPADLLEEDPFLLETLGQQPSGVRLERPGAQIGLLAPLSGPNAEIGRALLEGAQMALFDVGATDATLMPFDTRGAPDGAAQAASEAIGRGADILIGPLLAGSVEAVKPIAAQSGVPVVSFSNNPTVADDGAFVLGFSPAQQVRAIVDFAVREGATRFAVIAPNTPYGELVVRTVQETVPLYAATISKIRFIDSTATDFSETIIEMSDYEARREALLEEIRALEGETDEASRAALRRLELFDTLGEPDFDAILVPADSENALRTLSAQLAYYDVDQPTVRVLGLQIWDEFSGLSNEPSLIGAWYPAPDSALLTQFRDRYRRFYGRPPLRMASLGYDATALAAVLARGGAAGNASPYSRIALTNPQGFLGVDGLFRLNPDGAAQRAYAIREITRSGLRTVQPAATSFEPAIN
ncbi:MAG: penicillin-binding protein activator [Alphaproteobacteria bacterium]|nr:penicillin-binding protein activator [Alphaproteobacteria bacterium]